MLVCVACRAGQSGYSFEDEYASHAQRRKTRKKTFINLKKWGRKRDRMGGGDEGTGLSEETTLNVEDKYAVKVSWLQFCSYSYQTSPLPYAAVQASISQATQSGV